MDANPVPFGYILYLGRETLESRGEGHFEGKCAFWNEEVGVFEGVASDGVEAVGDVKYPLHCLARRQDADKC